MAQRRVVLRARGALRNEDHFPPTVFWRSPRAWRLRRPCLEPSGRDNQWRASHTRRGAPPPARTAYGPHRARTAALERRVTQSSDRRSIGGMLGLGSVSPAHEIRSRPDAGEVLGQRNRMLLGPNCEVQSLTDLGQARQRVTLEFSNALLTIYLGRTSFEHVQADGPGYYL